MSQTESFRAILQNDSKLLAKWNEVSGALIADAQAKGVTITPENLMTLTSVRLSVLSNDPSFIEDGKWEDEARTHIESWAKIERERELIAAIGDREHSKHEAAQAHLASITPEEKMRHARSNQLSAPAVKEKIEHTPERRAELIEQASKMRGGAKIAFARKYLGGA